MEVTMAASTTSTKVLRQVSLTAGLPLLLSLLLVPPKGIASAERRPAFTRLFNPRISVPPLADQSMPQPYRCRVDPPVNGGLHEFSSSNNSTYVVGVKGPAPAIIYLYEKNPVYAGAFGDYQLRLDDSSVAIERPSTSASTSTPAPTGLLSESSFRYFWVRAVSHPEGRSGELSIGRAGEDNPLLSFRDADFLMPTRISFRAAAIWLHSCSPSPPQPSLGCREHTVTHRYEFQQEFPIVDEVVSIGDSKVVRFMVKGSRDCHVRFKGVPSIVFYEFDLNFVNKIAVQKVSEYMDITTCHNCLSPNEFRLFTMVYNSSTISLFEGAELVHAKVSASLHSGFNITGVSFASMGSGPPVHWLHGCQGEAAALPGARHEQPEQPADARPMQPKLPGLDTLRPVSINTTGMLPGCRMVHTFKYHFDGFFSLSEEGYVSGSQSVLMFRVLGRKDIHLQLVSSLPPVVDDTYEIDIDFYNHTNLDRGKDVKVASTQHAAVLSPTEMRTFVLVHDAVTGVLNLTAVGSSVTRNLLLWRDPKPFPLRYFSISSGSSAGNDTTWAFGCDGQHQEHAVRDAARKQTGCSAPLLTYAYSHSQYLSVEREGEVDGPRRTLRVYLRALASGHIRLEATLPPGVDALFEIDLSHEGNTSIDSLGKRVATIRMPGLLSLQEVRGFWVRQDTEARTLEVGKEGSSQPLLSWTSPMAARFPAIRFFSLATSRSVGNGTWVYGCKNGSRPGQVPVVEAVPEEVPADIDELFGSDDLSDFSVEMEESDEDVLGMHPLPWPNGAFGPHSTTRPKPSRVPGLPASKALYLHFRVLGQPPPDGASVGVRLHLSRVIINDMAGTAELRGHLLSTWQDKSMGWEPKEFDDIRDVSNMEPGWSWTPTYTISHGDVEMDGLVHVRHTGAVRWEGALLVQSKCALQAHAWPRDRHTCVIEIGIESAHRLQMLDDLKHSTWVEPGAAHPLWHLEDKDITVAVTNESLHKTGGDSVPDGSTYLRISVTLSRSSPVLQHLLLAPFIVLATLCLLAYWVREPLPRDKVLLGTAALMLLVFSFVVLEAACPPALLGMPVIVEVYCWCMLTVALCVTVSCCMTAMSRNIPIRRPPALLCKMLSASLVRTLLVLHSDQVQQRGAEYELSPDTVDYVKGSTQVYFRFDQERASDCTCNDKGCSKQAAVEAQYFWALLALACERILSIICFIMLLSALIVVRL